jgi:dihydrofolate reductase
MRNVVLGVGISLDGYIARPDGAVDFLFMPKDYSMAAFFRRCDAAVMGRKSYEMGLKLGGGKISSFGMKCYVFSRTLGGGELTREFLREDLVDELYLGVVPVLIGEGIPAFPSGFPQREYKLTENKTFSQGLIALKYERVRTKQKAKK